MKPVSTIIIFVTLSLGIVCADYSNHPTKTCVDCMDDLNPYSVFATALPDATDFITNIVDKKWIHRHGSAAARNEKKTLRRPAFLRAVFARAAVNPNLQSA